jgi:hypothetical protein
VALAAHFQGKEDEEAMCEAIAATHTRPSASIMQNDKKDTCHS